jgi:hypothetical protein
MVGAWIVTALPFLYALITVVFILVPTSPPSSVGRLTYELSQFIPLVLILLLTTVFYIIGRSDKSNQDVVVKLQTGELDSSRVGGIAGE